MLYADDILLYKPISSSQDFTSFQNINLISNWVADNQMAVNLLKTKFMLISRSRSRPCNFPPLFLNSSKLERVSHFKYLFGSQMTYHGQNTLRVSAPNLVAAWAIYLELFHPIVTQQQFCPFINLRSYQCWSTHAWSGILT